MARPQVTFRVDGLAAVVRALLEMGLEVEDLKDAFGDIASTGANIASRLAPRRTGRLAGDVRGSRARNKAVVSAGRSAVPYAGAINYGWTAHGIQPAYFMQRADLELQPFALRRLEDDLNAKIASRGLR